jgi:hypothetical protein
VTQIVGVGLYRDEDIFVERVVRNVAEFCDELLLFDHRSRDGTGEILRKLAAEFPHARFEAIADPSISHDRLRPFIATDAWVFGVDGDELFDPERLRSFRPRLLGGEFDDWWLIRSNALHVVELDEGSRTARGYMAPPAPSNVKLHNFALIESWDGVHRQRLHGEEGLRFKPGREARKLELGKRYSWDDSPLRCLHVCFLRRSSRELVDTGRLNISELTAPARLPVRAWRRLRGRQPRWKAEHYREGPLQVASAEPFLTPSNGG